MSCKWYLSYFLALFAKQITLSCQWMLPKCRVVNVSCTCLYADDITLYSVYKFIPLTTIWTKLFTCISIDHRKTVLKLWSCSGGRYVDFPYPLETIQFILNSISCFSFQLTQHHCCFRSIKRRIGLFITLKKKRCT